MERRRLVAAVAPWLWAGGALCAASSAAVVAVFPSLHALLGPPAVVLLVAALGASAVRLVDLRGLRLQMPRTPALIAGCALVYAAVGIHYVNGLTASGDEPHYLLMAQSLWQEGDLELRDNLDRRDYQDYFPGILTPHWGAPRADGRPYPAHSPGLPVLLAPFYAVGGRTACVLVFALLAAALVSEVHTLAVRMTVDERAAFLAALAAAGPPVFYYSFHLYTELPSVLAIALSLRLLTGAPGPAGAALAGAAASTLPWFHVKMIPAAGALAVVALMRLRGRSLVVFVAIASLAAAGFAGYYYRVFGVPNPLAVYGGGIPPDAATSSVRAATGLLLDRSFGLLPHVPVFVLSFAGLPLLLRRTPREALPHLLVGAAIVAPLLGWRMWWGGQCPPARFLVPLVPLLALTAAARLRESQSGIARWRWSLLAWGFWLALLMAARPSDLLMLNRGDRPTRVWAAISGETPVERVLPSLVANSARDEKIAILWIAAIVVLLALDVVARRRERVDEALFRGLGLPLLLLLAIAVLVDTWARGPGSAG